MKTFFGYSSHLSWIHLSRHKVKGIFFLALFVYRNSYLLLFLYYGLFYKVKLLLPAQSSSLFHLAWDRLWRSSIIL